MFQFLSNPFTDPSDPWYYVLGVLCLALIFGALAAYLIITGKKAKRKGEEDPSGPDGNEEKNSDETNASPTQSPETDAVGMAEEQTEKTETE